MSNILRPGDIAAWNRRRVLIIDTHGYPPKTVDIRWTESGVPGSTTEISGHKRGVLVNELTPLTERDRPQLTWAVLDDQALAKVLKVFSAQFQDRKVEAIFSVKVGRKTVFARNSGVVRLYVAGDDGHIYSLKCTGMPSNHSDMDDLLSAAATGVIKPKSGVYRNGILA